MACLGGPVKTSPAPAAMYRAEEGLGLWEHRGKVAAVGIGHSPTFRRWDGTPENSVGGISLKALRRAIDDAGVSAADIDGLVMDPSTTTGAFWPRGKPLPWDAINAYHRTDDPLDGITGLSADWILANMPELTGIEFTMYGVGCMSNAVCVAAQAIGDGRAHTCLVLKSWHNLEGRYYQGGANAGNAISGSSAIRSLWGTPACFGTAVQFAEYCRKYGKSHDMMAPFIENSRRNGLKFPEGYWAQHRPEEITPEDYEAARWIAKPANLFDNDMPIMVSAAYLFTTAERARHLKQKPVYILNHATSRTRPARPDAHLGRSGGGHRPHGTQDLRGAPASPRTTSPSRTCTTVSPCSTSSTSKDSAIGASSSARRSTSTRPTSASAARTPYRRAAATSVAVAAVSGCTRTASSRSSNAPAPAR